MIGKELNLLQRRISFIETIPTSPSYEMSNIRCRTSSSPLVPIKRLEKNIRLIKLKGEITKR